jgi:hypothetical protein
MKPKGSVAMPATKHQAEKRDRGNRYPPESGRPARRDGIHSRQWSVVLIWCISSLVLLYSLYRNYDIKAILKSPLVEFSIDAKAPPGTK